MERAELVTQQVFGDGHTNRLTHHHHPTNAERLVGPLRAQGKYDAELTAGLDPVEKRVVQALGSTRSGKDAVLRYTYDAEKGILRRNDAFAFVEPPLTLPDLNWSNFRGFMRDRGVRKSVFREALQWVTDTSTGAIAQFEHTVVGSGKVIRRRGLADVIPGLRGLLVDVAAAKAELEPWLLVWGIKGDPIKQTKAEQERLRSETLGDMDIEGIGLLVEDAMRYVVHGVHRPRSLITEFLIENVSKHFREVDQAEDAVGTVRHLAPGKIRNIGPILAGDFISDMNTANLEQPLQDHNIAEDTLRIEDMYHVMTSSDESETTNVARGNYLRVLDYVLRDASGYNAEGFHLIRKHNLYEELRKSVDKLASMTPEQLASVYNGSHRLLMGRQILESVKAARLMIYPPEQSVEVSTVE